MRVPKWLMVTAGVVAVLAVGGALSESDKPAPPPRPVAATPTTTTTAPPPEPAYDPSTDPGTASVMCKDFVEQRLRAPATADFPWIPDDTQYYAQQRLWEITSHVDSENGFGALVRTSFVCSVKPDATGDNWTLVNLVTW